MTSLARWRRREPFAERGQIVRKHVDAKHLGWVELLVLGFKKIPLWLRGLLKAAIKYTENTQV